MLKKNLLLNISALSLTFFSLGAYVQPAAANGPTTILIASADAIEALRESGHAKYSKEDYQGAIADYTAAIKIEPKNASLYSARSEAYRFAKDYAKGITDQDMAIKLDPTTPSYSYQRAILKGEVSDYKGAIADMTTYIDALPPEARAGMYQFRGNMHQKSGTHQKAIEDLTLEIKLLPDSSMETYRQRAESYLTLGNKVEARKDLQAAIDLYQKLGTDYDGLREGVMQELEAIK
jgi:tetratricopeptide (TPR) repeat protein